jgi:branched-chain amino acid transport system permease protein
MREKGVIFCGLLLLVALPNIAGAMDDPYLVTLFSRVVIYALAAVSLDFILGYGRMVSLGHAAFFGLGGYVVGILATNLASGDGTAVLASNAALVSLPAAALVAAALALLVGAICLRTSGVYFIMITLAFAQMLYFLFVSLPAYGGEDGLPLWGRNELPGLDLSDDVTFYYLCLFCLIVYLLLCRRAIAARFGLVIRGAGANERRMLALGFPVYRYKLTAFVIAAAGAGLAGGLIANQAEFVSPNTLHWFQSGEILVMVLLGGMGTLYGPVFGAPAFILLEEILAGYTEHWMVFLGPILVLVVLFARGGLYPLLAGSGGRNG